MLSLCCSLAPHFRACLGDSLDLIATAGTCLLGLLQAIRTNPIVFNGAAVQRFYMDSRRYIEAMESLGRKLKPKDHMLMHMAFRIPYLGSPALYSNWLDESHNRLLRDVAAGSHYMVHDVRTLLEF